MIAISRDVARTFRALAKKCLAGRPRGPAPPVVIRIRAGVLTLWSRIESVGLRYSVAAPAAESETQSVPMDLLAAIEGPRSDLATLAVDAQLHGTASWTEQGEEKSHSFTAILPGKQHAVPVPPDLTPMQDAFRTALHECGRTVPCGQQAPVQIEVSQVPDLWPRRGWTPGQFRFPTIAPKPPPLLLHPPTQFGLERIASFMFGIT